MASTTDPTKSGKSTSEFALALLGPVVAIAVLVAQFFFNVTLNTDQLVTVGTFLIGHAGASFGYSKSRATVKEAAVIYSGPDVIPAASPGIKIGNTVGLGGGSSASPVDAAIAVMES